MDVSTLSSMLASPLPPSFLGTYNLSTSSLGCNEWCMVFSFLVLWSIIIIIIIILVCEFFIPALADAFSREFEG